MEGVNVIWMPENWAGWDDPANAGVLGTLDNNGLVYFLPHLEVNLKPLPFSVLQNLVGHGNTFDEVLEKILEYQASAPDVFFVCGRQIRPSDDYGQEVARSCKCQHVDVYSVNLGLIRVGLGGEPPEGITENVPGGPNWDCTQLYRVNHWTDGMVWPFTTTQDYTAKWGPAAGRDCDTLTDEEIADCIRAKPGRPGGSGYIHNCQSDIVEAIEGCCLSGYRTIARPNLGGMPLLTP